LGYIYLTSFGEVEVRFLLAGAFGVKKILRKEVRVSAVPSRSLSDLRGIYLPHMILLVVLSDTVSGLETERGGKVAVVGVGDLRGEEEEVFSELLGRIYRELGIAFGLGWCEEPSCLMNPFALSPRRLCPSCEMELRARSTRP